MINYALIVLLTAVVLFEIFEHVVLPLAGCALNRNKKSISGAESMIGKVAEVQMWDENNGQVFVDGELWQAICATPLVKGDRVVILAVAGLTLKVVQSDETNVNIGCTRGWLGPKAGPPSAATRAGSPVEFRIVR